MVLFGISLFYSVKPCGYCLAIVSRSSITQSYVAQLDTIPKCHRRLKSYWTVPQARSTSNNHKPNCR